MYRPRSGERGYRTFQSGRGISGPVRITMILPALPVKAVNLVVAERFM